MLIFSSCPCIYRYVQLFTLNWASLGERELFPLTQNQLVMPNSLALIKHWREHSCADVLEVRLPIRAICNTFDDNYKASIDSRTSVLCHFKQVHCDTCPWNTPVGVPTVSRFIRWVTHWLAGRQVSCFYKSGVEGPNGDLAEWLMSPRLTSGELGQKRWFLDGV